MNSNTILLSLCIPTYNRVGILIPLLERLVLDPDFDEEVEVVVSDNCSTDDTEAQVRKIAAIHPAIKYYRNPENVRDRNFYLVLSRGEGRYLKLMNDYVVFKAGGLKVMKEYVRKYESQDVNLFFYSRLRSPYRASKEVYIENMDSFVCLINNKITWIANFGVWKRNFEELANSEALWNTQLAQMEWTLQEVSLRNTVVANLRCYDTLPVPNKQMSYTFFVPHVVNYYDIYKAYVKRGLITEKTIEYDKYRVLSNFVGSRIIQYLYLEKEVSFDRTNAQTVLDGYFGDIPYYRYLKLKGGFLRMLQRSGILSTLKSIRNKFKRK